MKRFFAANLIIVLVLTVRASAQADRDVIQIQIDPKNVLGPISPDFLGFGYETSAVAQPNYFTAKNAALVQLYRNLSTHGLVRIGGNISDHTKYIPDGTATAQPEEKVTIINHKNLIDFDEFLQATGWKAMWGLNLGTGSKQEAADEAVAVEGILKDRLQSLEIGNEVDLHGHYVPDLKGYPAYHDAYLDYKSAIRTALPASRFSGPDAAGSINYVRSFVSTEAADMQLITMHYYRGGAGSKNATIETLLARNEGWEKQLAALQKIGHDARIPYRINEVNSFSGGGKPGVSDTFASALWCLDYMFLLASYDCAGVNMETDINQHFFVSHYSPIVHDVAGHCSARPEHYGMLAFAMAGKGELLKTTVEKNEVNLTAYATKDEQGLLWLTVINKDLSRDAKIEARLPGGYTGADAFRLEAPSAQSKDRVTFAGREVSDDGAWTSESPEKILLEGSSAEILVPHASAVVLRLGI